MHAIERVLLVFQERLYDFARTLDEELHHGSWCSVLQGDYSDWKSRHGQVHRHWLERQPPCTEMHQGSWKDCQKASGREQSASCQDRTRPYDVAWNLQALRPKSIADQRPREIVERRSAPGLIDQFRKLNLAAAG